MDCDVCGNKMYEGELGQAYWICMNPNCEKANPDWPTERLRKKIAPLQAELEKLSHLGDVSIKLFEGRWIGDGSATITLVDGNSFECHWVDGVFYPTNESAFTDEIKERFIRLIDCRKKLSEIILEK